MVKKPIDLLNEMFEGDINVKESNVKIKIDEWYKANMINYTSKLEDIAFCSDRTYDIGYNTSGWNKDYSNYNTWLYFGSATRLEDKKPSLVCPRQIDKFTVSADNGNGDLTYSVGMITVEEVTFAGGVVWKTNTSYYLYNGINNRLFSPSDFYNIYALHFHLLSPGDIDTTNVLNQYGVRPVLSLKQGIVLSSGTGTATDPFIVE